MLRLLSIVSTSSIGIKSTGAPSALVIAVLSSPANAGSGVIPAISWLVDGRRLRVLAVVDDYMRESLATEVDTWLPGLWVVRVLDRMAERRRVPEVLTIDNGPEFAGKVLDAWVYQRGCACTSSLRGDQCRTPTSRASMASCATSASANSGSRRS
jgi:hypothetical protein